MHRRPAYSSVTPFLILAKQGAAAPLDLLLLSSMSIFLSVQSNMIFTTQDILLPVAFYNFLIKYYFTDFRLVFIILCFIKDFAKLHDNAVDISRKVSITSNNLGFCSAFFFPTLSSIYAVS